MKLHVPGDYAELIGGGPVARPHGLRSCTPPVDATGSGRSDRAAVRLHFRPFAVDPIYAVITQVFSVYQGMDVRGVVTGKPGMRVRGIPLLLSPSGLRLPAIVP